MGNHESGDTYPIRALLWFVSPGCPEAWCEGADSYVPDLEIEDTPEQREMDLVR